MLRSAKESAASFATSDRIFEKWSMAGIDIDPLLFQLISELRARRLEVIDDNVFMKTMREFGKLLTAAK